MKIITVKQHKRAGRIVRSHARRTKRGKKIVRKEISFKNLEKIPTKNLLKLYKKHTGKYKGSSIGNVNVSKISGILLDRKKHPTRKWA